MTKILQKTSIIATIAMTVLLTGIYFISNEVNQAEAGTIGLPPPPPSSICPEDGTVQHWDKIIFQIKSDKSKQLPEEYIKTTLDLKIIDPPGKIVNLEKEIFDHLKKQLEIREIKLSDLDIEILDVRYETVTCGLIGPEGPEGPKGDTGEQGPAGEQKLVVTTTAETFQPTPSSSESFSSPPCAPNEELVGGGYVGAVSGVISNSGNFAAKTWDIKLTPHPNPGPVVVIGHCAKLVP